MNPQLPNQPVQATQPMTSPSVPTQPSSVGNGGMTKLILIFGALIVVLGGVFVAINYLNNQMKQSTPPGSTAQVATETKVNTPQAPQAKAVEAQLDDIDADLTALDNDLASLDSSLNDKQGDLSE